MRGFHLGEYGDAAVNKPTEHPNLARLAARRAELPVRLRDKATGELEPTRFLFAHDAIDWRRDHGRGRDLVLE